jgi:tRNA G26 N,N-dimethylase Trm1
MKVQQLKNLIREEARKVLKEHDDQTNYMFFQNLHTIKRMIEKMMEMNSEQVDQLLSNGHGWAVDHIAS